MHLDPTSLFALNPLDIVLALLGIAAGSLIRRKFVGFGIFIQISIILVKIVRHYYATHPEMKQKWPLLKHKRKLDTIYKEKLEMYDLGLKETQETGAAG